MAAWTAPVAAQLVAEETRSVRSFEAAAQACETWTPSLNAIVKPRRVVPPDHMFAMVVRSQSKHETDGALRSALFRLFVDRCRGPRPAAIAIVDPRSPRQCRFWRRLLGEAWVHVTWGFDVLVLVAELQTMPPLSDVCVIVDGDHFRHLAFERADFLRKHRRYRAWVLVFASDRHRAQNRSGFESAVVHSDLFFAQSSDAALRRLFSLPPNHGDENVCVRIGGADDAFLAGIGRGCVATWDVDGGRPSFAGASPEDVAARGINLRRRA